MRREFHLIVHTVPVPKARPRATNIGGRPRIYTPTVTARAEWEIRQAWIAKFGPQPLSGPISMSVRAFVPMPASIPKRDRVTALPTKRPDIDNYVKTALDGLLGVAYPDDAAVVDVRAAKRYAWPGGVPRWEITVATVELASECPPAEPHVSPWPPSLGVHEPAPAS